MTAHSTKLQRQWVAAMRASVERATGQECDFSPHPDAPDAFDPIGLLVIAATDGHAGIYFHAGTEGEWVPRRVAEAFAVAVGFPPSKLYNLCLMNDTGVPWDKMADFVSAWCFYTNDGQEGV